MVCVMAFGFLISILIGLAEKPVFRSAEVLQIAPPKVAAALAETTVGDTLAARLPLLRQRLLARGTLQEITDAYGIFADRSDLTAGERADLLRRSVAISWRTDEPGPTVIVVSATLGNADHARFVAQELGHRLIKLSVQMRLSEAQATLDFLSKAAETKKKELSRAESRLAAYRSDPAENGPGPQRSGSALNARDLGILESEARRLHAELAHIADRRSKAEMGLELETRRHSERLLVIEPAETVERPVSDRRIFIVTLGGVLSSLIAFALALILERRKPVMRTASQVYRQTGVMPIATVPHVNMHKKNGIRRFLSLVFSKVKTALASIRSRFPVL